MAKILLVADQGIGGVPDAVVSWLREYTNQGHTFILGDSVGSDSLFHREISGVGARTKSVIYCMNEPSTNKFDIPVRAFMTFYDDETHVVTITDENKTEVCQIQGVMQEIDIPYNPYWYSFRDRQMVKDCDFAIILCSTANHTKRVDKIITLLNIFNKQCHVVKMD